MLESKIRILSIKINDALAKICITEHNILLVFNKNQQSINLKMVHLKVSLMLKNLFSAFGNTT